MKTTETIEAGVRYALNGRTVTVSRIECGRVWYTSPETCETERYTTEADFRIAAVRESGPTRGQWSARCCCYHGHNSASGRCNRRNVFDPHAKPGQAVYCEDCRRECRKVKP